MLSQDLKDINWKRELNTWIKVLLDVKVAGLLVLMGFILYGIGYDTVYRPTMEQIKQRDEAIKIQKEQLEQKKGLKQQYKTWEEELKNLTTQMIPIKPGDSLTVMSVTESSELLKLAQGKKRDAELLPPLPPPHSERKKVSLSPTGQEEINLGTAPAGGEALPDGMERAAGPPETEAGSPREEATAVSIPVHKYNYEIKMSGTYPALMDFLNEIIAQPSLYQINKVSLAKTADQNEPNPDEFPNHPVSVDMVVSVSVFFYGNNQ